MTNHSMNMRKIETEITGTHPSHLTKKIILTVAVMALAGLGAHAQFLPQHLAVLRAGNGTVDLHLKQAPTFVDEFTPGALNNGPVMSVALPTNGPTSIFFNGHAATEGMLSLSADGKLLTFAGYGGKTLLEQGGTPSLMDIGRAVCTVDAAGKATMTIYEQHGGPAKMNPRGAVTDGAGHFWTCGNASGTAFYDAGGDTLQLFSAIPDSRQVKIIAGTLYASLNEADATYLDTEPGIFSFEDGGQAAALPEATNTTLKLVVPASKPYDKIAGFDLSPDGNTAYLADVESGIEKYVKLNGHWKLAYNFAIPQNIMESSNHADGCFAVAVDFSGSSPIIYATTTEGYNGSVNSNRVVQIVDTNSAATVTTIAQAPSENIAYRGIAFTPGSK
ncbi:MAG TPA: hypothetical protein VK811_06720 [Candidatus Acidoferrum sp.]|jgi:hypothetical protein|nr:hypothetical protein [Candidatus Acidoferrum sp.]